VAAPSGHDVSRQPIGTSFYVRFSLPPPGRAGTIVEIGALAKFRYLKERGWRDLDPALSRAMADGLRKRLEALP
jgi:hypothetical protein